jgi:O-antigen/teichoic acid export membrane protein
VSTSPDVGRILVRNTAWNYAGFAANIATNLVAFPFVVSRLGDAAAGVWLLLGSVTGYMGLMELGLVPSLVQLIAASRPRGVDADIDRAVSTALFLLVALATVPLALSFATPWLVSLLRVDPAMAPSAILALRIAIVGFALRMPLAAQQAVLLGSQRQDRASQMWIVMGWTKLACAFVVLGNGGGLVALVLAEVLVHLLAGVPVWRWIRAELPNLRPSVTAIDRDTARTLLSYGASLFVLSVTVLIVEQTDRLVIAAFLPVDQVTMYSAAWKLYMLAYAIPTTLLQALSPMVAALHGRGDSEAIRRLFLRMSRYSAAIAAPLVCVVAACRDWLLTVWMGERFVAAGPVVLVLLASFYVTSHNHAGWSVMAGRRQLGRFVYVYNGPQALLNLGLSLVLVKPLGILGVALGTMLPALCLQPLFIRFVYPEIGVTLGDVLREVVRPTSGLALVAFSPLLLIALVTPAAASGRVVAAAACSLVYGLAFWRWCMASEERAAVARLLPFGLPRWLSA